MHYQKRTSWVPIQKQVDTVVYRPSYSLGRGRRIVWDQNFRTNLGCIARFCHKQTSKQTSISYPLQMAKVSRAEVTGVREDGSWPWWTVGNHFGCSGMKLKFKNGFLKNYEGCLQMLQCSRSQAEIWVFVLQYCVLGWLTIFTPLSRLEYLREQCLLTKVCGDSQTNHRPVSLVLRSSSSGKMVTLVFHAGFCDEAETDWKGPGEVLLWRSEESLPES